MQGRSVNIAEDTADDNNYVFNAQENATVYFLRG
jgi:hypothetical protein